MRIKFQSTWYRQRYIEPNPAQRGGGDIRDTATRLGCTDQDVHNKIDRGELDALVVTLHDGTDDIIVPDDSINRYFRRLESLADAD